MLLTGLLVDFGIDTGENLYYNSLQVALDKIIF